MKKSNFAAPSAASMFCRWKYGLRNSRLIHTWRLASGQRMARDVVIFNERDEANGFARVDELPGHFNCDGAAEAISA